MRSATEEIVNGNVHVDDDQTHSALHFDGENFFAGQGRILGLKEAVIASIQQNDAQGGQLAEEGEAPPQAGAAFAHARRKDGGEDREGQDAQAHTGLRRRDPGRGRQHGRRRSAIAGAARFAAVTGAA